MEVEVKNSKFKPKAIKPLFDYFQSVDGNATWVYKGLIVELDPTFDFQNNDALIRWTDINEGFNDKFIVYSLKEFNSHFKLVNA